MVDMRISTRVFGMRRGSLITKYVMSSEQDNSIRAWLHEADLQKSSFVAFFIFYMCLDALATALSEKDTDAEKLLWLTSSENLLRQSWNEVYPQAEVYVEKLRRIGVVEDMRPGHRGELTHLTEVGNFSQMIHFIYQVRCNLFHGGKRITSINDKNLVTISSNILKVWLKHFIESSERNY